MAGRGAEAMIRRSLAMLLALVAAAACGDPDDVDVAGDPRCTKDLGEAALRFVNIQEACIPGAWTEISEGEQLQFVLGPRFNWMVQFGVLAEGIYFGDGSGCGESHHPTRTVQVLVDGDEVTALAYDCWSCGHPDTQWVELAESSVDLNGSTLTLVGEVTDMCGRRASATVNLELFH